MLMESCPKSSVAGEGVLEPEKDLHLPVKRDATLLDDSNSSCLNEVFFDQYTEVDVSSESEWLSNFVEECLSSAGNCLPPSIDPQNLINTNPNSSKNFNSKPHMKRTFASQNPKKASIPGKPRTQRGRKPTNSKTQKIPLFKWPDDHNFQSGFSDPPLLEQGYWLADSELLSMPRKQDDQKMQQEESKIEQMEVEKENSEEDEEEKMQLQQPRKCSHCQTQKTPQWRAGPMGPKTLCNACGMRYFKSGKLLPEYRPAKSPTFVSYKHSNSHKKVLQMRMALLSSSTPVQHVEHKSVGSKDAVGTGPKSAAIEY
ncbi:hypothetical protein V2J09_014371 [Rumex salicifolius]